jgi:hypothetical protein
MSSGNPSPVYLPVVDHFSARSHDSFVRQLDNKVVWWSNIHSKFMFNKLIYNNITLNLKCGENDENMLLPLKLWDSKWVL